VEHVEEALAEISGLKQVEQRFLDFLVATLQESYAKLNSLWINCRHF
jgi:hypothetical protein